MRVINVSLNELETKVLMIGFQGENEITQVRIDAAEILTDYPTATPTLIVKPLFGFAYPVIVTKEGTDVVWEIDNSVLSFHGDGEIQLTFTQGTVIAKSYVGRIRIKRSLAVNGEAPDPIETWEQAATAKLAEVDAQISELEGMVDAAEAAKDEAQEIVDDAAADIQAAGAAQVGAVQAEGTTQVGAVQAKGTEVLNSIPSDYSTLSGDVTDLKSALTEAEGDIDDLETAVEGKQDTLTFDNTPTENSTNPVKSGGVYSAIASEAIRATAAELLKVNKPTTSPNGTNGQFLKTNGDGTTVWDDPFEEPVSEAVSDWLDEHPEATTTVQDGSLTEEKFTAATWDKVKNGYVTPQMYGAVADGTTDDTVAIQAAFDSGYDVFFTNGVYMTSGVTIPATIHVKFDNATLKANTEYQEYVLNVTAKVYFTGYLKVDGDTKAYCGVVFTNAGSSYIEMINVDYCLSWGVDIVSGGHMVFDHIYTAYCGNSISATVSYVSSKVLNIDSSLTLRQKEILSADKYYSHIYVQDDTGYNDDTSDKRPGPFIYDATGYDKESGQIATMISVGSNYTSKACYILCGGGIHVNVNINTQIDFNIIDTRLGPTGIRFDSTYGHHIQNMYSQSDRIPVLFASYNLGSIIGSITAEGSKSGYNIWSKNYNYSVILARSTGYDSNFLSSQVATLPHKSSPLYNPTHLKTLIRRTIPFYYYMGETLILTEQSPDNIFFQTSRSGLMINLIDTFQSYKSYNPWGVKTIYFMPNSTQSSDITFTLANSLIDNGYTIHGGQNGAITFPRPSLWFKVEIYLSYATKTFTLSVTPITKFEPSA